jgi:hypothetical protein
MFGSRLSSAFSAFAFRKSRGVSLARFPPQRRSPPLLASLGCYDGTLRQRRHGPPLQRPRQSEGRRSCASARRTVVNAAFGDHFAPTAFALHLDAQHGRRQRGSSERWRISESARPYAHRPVSQADHLPGPRPALRRRRPCCTRAVEIFSRAGRQARCVHPSIAHASILRIHIHRRLLRTAKVG